MSHSITRRQWVKGVACAPLALAGLRAGADTYPAKTVTVILPTAPGGNADLTGRRICQGLASRFGQSFVAENRPGASSRIGAGAAARAAPDGYTLVQWDNGLLIPSITSVVPFDPVRDFTPLSMVAELSMLLVVNANFPASTLPELIAYVKSNPGKVNYASLGVGSQHHLVMAQFAKQAGLDMLDIPYAGVAPAITAMLGEQVSMMFSGMSSHLPHIRSGKFKAIAYAGSNRHPMIPNVPTFAEAGMPGFIARAWYGMFAPRQTPQPIVQTLSRAIWDLVNSKDYTETILLKNGFDGSFSVTPDAFAAHIADEEGKWRAALRQLNLKPMGS
ncbi:MAG: tripartite tricarboxylate transporter substrate binding protein [Burkholderiaceae bacterium]|nr:tripartite tricarboxylate transporter substrate binding protein [Burkholderiaceae bacterium]